MKAFLYSLLIISSLSVLSCNENGDGEKNTNDTTYSGLEGTREDASQLSNATVDTTSGQRVTKEPIDSTVAKKDTLPLK